eukprot:365635-Chlamydomonas_euryale.AAC.9
MQPGDARHGRSMHVVARLIFLRVGPEFLLRLQPDRLVAESRFEATTSANLLLVILLLVQQVLRCDGAAATRLTIADTQTSRPLPAAQQIAGTHARERPWHPRNAPSPSAYADEGWSVRAPTGINGGAEAL